jgi:catechol 2,3-dioxygenase-like lactoylglutathione lyase family enzyme
VLALGLAIGGTVLLVTAAGDTRIALFRDRGTGEGNSGDHTIAFRISGEGFVAFVEHLPELRIPVDKERLLSSGDIVDHGLAWSIYFRDPDGNRIELTTYDHDAVSRALAG